ncbi:hypothetical protein IscW_ISCW019995, partial [Ixodes scapularis]
AHSAALGAALAAVGEASRGTAGYLGDHHAVYRAASRGHCAAAATPFAGRRRRREGSSGDGNKQAAGSGSSRHLGFAHVRL